MSYWLMLDGGPCAGGYFTARAPVDLQAVRSPKGKCDVLDLAEDQAASNEEIHLYERLSTRPEGTLCARGAGCGPIVKYRYVRPLRGQCTLFSADVGELGGLDRS